MKDDLRGPTGQPGLDLHEWASARASIEEDLAKDPAAGPGLLVEIAQRMLVAHGYVLEDEVPRQGESPSS